MKKFLILIFSILLVLPMVIFAEEEKAKVKVYVFEAGGCPYCEAQIEYLEGLEGYNKTFEIVKKELYVDHVDWAQGKDYELGKKVAEAFLKAGFKDASYKGTPFVVISDLYAAATYDTNLETTINQAYEEGDKDAVKCIGEAEDNGLTCISSAPEKEEENNSKAGIVVLVLAGLAFVGAIIYAFKNKDNNVNEEYEDDEMEEKVYDKALDGLDTPEYGGKPKKNGKVFAGWEPKVARKVKGNATYTATWKEDKNHNGVADDEEYRTVTYKDAKDRPVRKTSNNKNTSKRKTYNNTKKKNTRK